uniref:Uncharacterized protein n=1 Tax=Rhizophora mucronata TaxID=61149 RepID=A0A2P2PBA3_RHIMU
MPLVCPFLLLLSFFFVSIKIKNRFCVYH